MAKGKKSTSALTSEEKLQAALVPIEEYPYKIPQNWQWVRLNNLVSIVTGKKDANYGSDNGKYFFFTCASEPLRCDDYSFEGESLLLPGNGANVGEVFYYDGKFEAYQRTYVLQKLSDEIDMRYLYYQILGFWKDYNKDKQYGSATNYIKLGNFLNYNVPIAPRAEQQRIVEKIESLFSKLDEAKEKAQEVIEGFDSRRAAILAQAFSGKLTETWRENKYSLVEWKETTLSEVVSGFKYGSSEKSTYENDGMPVLRIPNIGDGVIDFSDMKFLAHDDVDRDNQVHEDDLLIIRSNGSRDLVGKCAIVPALERDYAYASFLIRIKPSEEILPRFLLLYLNSSIARSQMFIKAKSSSGIHNINSKELGAIKIKVPYLEEQKEIVRILDEIFAKENEARSLVEMVADKIDAVKKSILAKAFRGELGTNDSSDEPAEELLKRILIEAPVEEKKKSTTRKKKVKVVMNKDLLEAVREAGKITPERLKEETGLGIDEFYEELKRLTESGQVSEKKEGGDVYLEVGDADR